MVDRHFWTHQLILIGIFWDRKIIQLDQAICINSSSQFQERERAAHAKILNVWSSTANASQEVSIVEDIAIVRIVKIILIMKLKEQKLYQIF